MQSHITRIQLPIGLADMSSDRWMAALGGSVDLEISADYERLLPSGPSGEVFSIQRLLSLARNRTPIRVLWPAGLLARMPSAASLYPLLAVAVSLQGATHESEDIGGEELSSLLARARRQIFNYRLRGDLFSDNQALLCVDARGHGRPQDLYDRSSNGLRSREDIETTVLSVLSPHLSNTETASQKFVLASALAVIVAELFENTHLHGRLDSSKAPMGPDAMRGLLFNRIAVTLPSHRKSGHLIEAHEVPGLEVSVFDSGLGYFASYTRQALDSSTSLDDEWKVMHKCFSRHFSPEHNDFRQRQRGMGLYEVLRALQELKGSIEVRTGRLFAYRTFFEGELLPQMHAPSGQWARIRLPKPVLLDVQNKLTPRPSANDAVVGAAIRIVIPLA
ncbi:hypothetical protein [Variovorax sp. PDC80]|uniref:hypothetical protein n=1 Tax=Variovorax sp. PDC80 TaxID=1882827 RepID=UPI00116078A9|nr:hypothetical protein [Variovorax sp. PDC80]